MFLYTPRTQSESSGLFGTAIYVLEVVTKKNKSLVIKKSMLFDLIVINVVSTILNIENKFILICRRTFLGIK